MKRQTALVTLAVAVAFTLAGCSFPHTSPAATLPKPTTATAPTPVPTTTPTAAPAWNVPHDSGPQTNAEGTVTTNAADVPIAYTVASDDNAGGICNRLGVRFWQLQYQGMSLSTYPTIYPNQVLQIVEIPEPAYVLGDNNAVC
jgi:hypothetical protein